MFSFDNSFFNEMEGCYQPCSPESVPDARLVFFNAGLAGDLGIGTGETDTDLAQILSGNQPPEGADVLAQVYAGHQFGHFSPQLGDGRAHILGEHITPDGTRFDIALKGSGRTVFSRSGDGKAAIKPVLREYLLAEAMAALGIPTTRALAVVTTGESVMRESPLAGAVLTRIAASHLRVGTFQYFAARGDNAMVGRLVEYALTRHYPDFAGPKGQESGREAALALVRGVAGTQARLIAKWMGVGFIHGVMNTDNVAISGETIDYGPCAFMDGYSRGCVFSSIDRQGRYAYGNQPIIGQWNIARLGEAVLGLLDNDVAAVQEVVNEFAEAVSAEQVAVFRAKLGLDESGAGAGSDDADLVDGFLRILADGAVDFTRGFRAVCDGFGGGSDGGLGDDFKAIDGFEAWHKRYLARVEGQAGGVASARELACAHNPIYIPRNHLVESALSAAESGDYAPFCTLQDVLSSPYTRRKGLEDYEHPPLKVDTEYRTFCGT